MTQTQQQITGRNNEVLACQFLKQHKLKLVETNYHCRYGEIDLIMRDKDSLVFIEVRYRAQDRFGSAMESVNVYKQRRLIATAKHYLQQTQAPLPTRFDVIAISGKGHETKINWLKNAFGT